jgi:hypothetical protein
MKAFAVFASRPRWRATACFSLITGYGSYARLVAFAMKLPISRAGVLAGPADAPAALTRILGLFLPRRRAELSRVDRPAESEDDPRFVPGRCR